MTQQASNPQACRPNPEYNSSDGWSYPAITTQCVSASAANDWDYLKVVLGFVTQSSACSQGHWCGNRDRIYFTGQSMGGMSSLQWATQDPASDYYLGATCFGDLRPKAITAASPGGSRLNELNLGGRVPALVMQGSADHVAVPVLPAGRMRNFSSGSDSRLAVKDYPNIPHFLAELLGDRLDALVVQAVGVLGLGNYRPKPDGTRDKVHLLLQADTQQGGAFLKDHLPAYLQGGCPAKVGGATSI